MEDKLIIYGISQGDSSVGINSDNFVIDTGIIIDDNLIYSLKNKIPNKEKIKEIINKRIDNLYKFREPTYQEYLEMLITETFNDLHDNGNINITFSSDELEEKDAETGEEGLEKI